MRAAWSSAAAPGRWGALRALGRRGEQRRLQLQPAHQRREAAAAVPGRRRRLRLPGATAGGRARLRLRFTLSCAEPATLQLDTPVADDRWHMVLLTRDAPHRPGGGRRTRAAGCAQSGARCGWPATCSWEAYPRRATLGITLSTVKYEPPFRGLLANRSWASGPRAAGQPGPARRRRGPPVHPGAALCQRRPLHRAGPRRGGLRLRPHGLRRQFCSEGEPGEPPLGAWTQE